MTGDPIQAILMYSYRKAKGLAQVQRIGGSYAIVSQRFDPNTGESIDPDVAAVGTDQLQAMRDDLARQLAIVDEVMADIQGL